MITAATAKAVCLNAMSEGSASDGPAHQNLVTKYEAHETPSKCHVGRDARSNGGSGSVRIMVLEGPLALNLVTKYDGDDGGEAEGAASEARR